MSDEIRSFQAEADKATNAGWGVAVVNRIPHACPYVRHKSIHYLPQKTCRCEV